MNKLKKISAFKNYLPIYLILIILIDLLLIKLPLTKVFGYEYSLINSCLLVFLSGIYTIKLLKKASGKELKSEVFKSLNFAFISFLLLPAFISIANSFFTIKCSLWDGFLFYFVITAPSVIIGSSLGLLSFTLFKRYKIFLFIIIYILILLIPLFEFYFNPQVYFYNPILGYLPGTIYDEGLSVDLKLAVYRILNLIFFGGIFYLLYRIKFDGILISKKLLFILVLLVPSLFLFFSPQLKYSSDKNRIENELAGKIISPHFIIYYPESIDSNLIKDIALHHEYYYKELSQFFQAEPHDKIESFLFLNHDQKKRLFGSGNADVAKPWLLQIYTAYDDYSETLKHEIAHCFTSAFAEGIFKVASGFNPYLIEGAAVAADPIYDENNIHFMAALAFHNNYKIKIKDIFSYFSFFGQTSGISYVYAGSFSKYLIESYGIERYKELYNDLDFENIYKMPLDSLSKRYFNFIDTIYTGGGADKANYYFGRKSIFYKVCPRYIADRLKDAWSLFNDKNYEEANKIFRNIYNLGKNYSALIGMAECEANLNNRDKAISLLKKNINNYKNTAYFYGIELQLGDLQAEQNYYTEADSIYSKLLLQDPNRKFYYISHLRKSLLRDSLINIYLKGNDFDKFQVIKSLNEKKYDYNTIPVFINLAKNVNEQYALFLKHFNKTLHVDNYDAGYALYKLSIYMLENLDFPNARKMAALSLRYNADKNFNYILLNNYYKADWFYYHGGDILKQMNTKNK